MKNKVNDRQLKKRALEALEKTLGNISQASKISSIPRSTIYKWLKEDQDFKQSFENIAEVAVDFAESRLFENIKKGKEVSIIYYLNNRGKKRGYNTNENYSDEKMKAPQIIIEGTD